jgi:hypothetical protein
MATVTNVCTTVSANCGNNTRETDELCDDTDIDHDAIKSRCGKDETYVSSRVRCNAFCDVVDASACVSSTYNVVMDEYLASRDADGTQSMALAIRNQTGAAFAPGACSLSLLDKTGKWLRYYGLDEIAGAEDAMFSACKPLVICSEATWNNETHTQVFANDLCDATLALPTEDGSYLTLLDASDIAYVQITCGGEYIDVINLDSIRTSLLQGYTHGKLGEDKSPWPDMASLSMKDRMVYDKTFETASFASNACE